MEDAATAKVAGSHRHRSYFLQRLKRIVSAFVGSRPTTISHNALESTFLVCSVRRCPPGNVSRSVNVARLCAAGVGGCMYALMGCWMCGSLVGCARMRRCLLGGVARWMGGCVIVGGCVSGGWMDRGCIDGRMHDCIVLTCQSLMLLPRVPPAAPCSPHYRRRCAC